MLLVACVQFVNVLDFMMVMPLGPDFARDLNIPTSQLGVVTGSYTGAAAVAGLLGGMWFDRFDRRRIQLLAIFGLAAATALGALATDLRTLVAARMLAGLFGGPVTSLSLSAIADVVPDHRRGRAMGVVMSAFSLASIVGLPIGLELATLGSWRTPFFVVGALAAVAGAAAVTILPEAPPTRDVQARSTLALLGDGRIRLSLFTSGVLLVGHFAVVANLATWLQFNQGYPREDLSWLYLWGGLASLASLQVAGRLVDRAGPVAATTLSTVVLVGVFGGAMLPRYSPIPMALVFVLLMGGASVRNVALNTLTSRVPSTAERGRFMSLQSTVQHLRG